MLSIEVLGTKNTYVYSIWMKSGVCSVRGKNKKHVQRNTFMHKFHEIDFALNVIHMSAHSAFCNLIVFQNSIPLHSYCFSIHEASYKRTTNPIVTRMHLIFIKISFNNLRRNFEVYAATSNGHRHVCFKKPYRKVFISYFIHGEQKQQQQQR